MKQYLSSKSESFWIVCGCTTVMAICTYFLIQPPPIQIENRESPSIGIVRPSGSDVRFRMDKELNWSKLPNERDVLNNDRIFAGANSRAFVQLKNSSTFTVEPNSLLQISNDSDHVELNLEQGSFFSFMKGSSPVQVRNKDQVLELSSAGATVHVAARPSGFKLVVLDGQTKIKGSPRAISANQESLIDKKRIQTRDLEFKLISPSPGSIVWTAKSPIHFQWSTSGHDSEVALEISEDANFTTMVSRTVLRKQLAEIMLSPDHSYYWRVRSMTGQASSPISSLSVFGLRPPSLPADSTVGVKADWRGRVLSQVRFSWRDPSYSESYTFEIARQPDFAKIEYTVSTHVPEVRLRGLIATTYYWRVTSHHPKREDLRSSPSKLELIDGKLELLPSELREPASAPAPQADVVLAKPVAPPPPPLRPLQSPQLAREIYRYELVTQGLPILNPISDIIATEMPELEWTPIADSTKYRIEISSRPDFKVLNTRESSNNRWTWNDARPGQYFARVIATVKGPNGMERETRGSAAQIGVWLAPPLIKSWNEKTFNLKWQAHPLARQTEIQISNNSDFKKRETFRTTADHFRFRVLTPGQKFVRVRSLDRLGWAISRFSVTKEFRVENLPAPHPPAPILAKAVEPPPKREIAQTVQMAKPEPPPVPLRYPPPFYSVFIGGGASYLSFAQSSNSDLGTTSFAKMTSPTYAVGGAIRIAPRSVLAFEYQDRKVQTSPDANALILKNDFDWRRMSAELHYHLWEFSNWLLTGLGGIQVHQLPFFSSNGDQTASLYQNQLLNLSVGARAIYFWRDHFEFESLLRLQSTVSSKSMNGDGLSVSPGMMFDGSLGVARKIYKELKLGVYWYGQSERLSYNYLRNGSQTSGDQAFFDSTFQLRLIYAGEKSSVPAR